jgi:hypothetical protein
MEYVNMFLFPMCYMWLFLFKRYFDLSSGPNYNTMFPPVCKYNYMDQETMENLKV